jgi:hypothetical protein
MASNAPADTRVELLIQELSRANIEKRLLLQELRQCREKLSLQESLHAKMDEGPRPELELSTKYDRSRLYSEVHAGVHANVSPMQAAIHHELQLVTKERDDLRTRMAEDAAFRTTALRHANQTTTLERLFGYICKFKAIVLCKAVMRWRAAPR